MEVAALTSEVLRLTFGIAFVFGAIANRTHFCTMGAVSDIVNIGDWSRMRMWLLAMGVAILGAGALQAAGLINLDQSIYRMPTLNWLSALLGGFCFGFGMVLGSGCGAKTLIRMAGGSLKALVVVLVLAIFAYMTMRGVFSGVRVHWLDPVAIAMPAGAHLPGLLQACGLSEKQAFWSAVLGLGGGLTAFALAGREFRTPGNLLGGIGIGACVVAAWYVSGHVGYLAEHPDTLEAAFLGSGSGRMEALTFVAPQAYTLELLLLWSDASRTLNIAIVTVLGVLAGAWTIAVASRRFRWEGFANLEDLATHLLGAALMGFGGVTAMGCTIGQGISGVSTLALGSLLTVLAIVAGAVAALKLQYWRVCRAA